MTDAQTRTQKGPAACDHLVGYRRDESGGEGFEKGVRASQLAAADVTVEQWANYCSLCGARLRKGEVVSK